MTFEGMGPCLSVEGSMTALIFEAYIERVLSPTLKPGQVVVMDNLSAGKEGKVRKLIGAQDCELLYLLPYSPNLNPIEEAVSEIKVLLLQAGARTREALVEAIGWALDVVTS